MDSMEIVRRAQISNRLGLYAGVTLLIAIPLILQRTAQDQCDALVRRQVIEINYKELTTIPGHSLPLYIAGPTQAALLVSAVLLTGLAIVNQRLWKQISHPLDLKSEKGLPDTGFVPNADFKSDL